MKPEEIIQTLGLEDAPQDQQQRIVAGVVSVVESRIVGAVDELLTDEQAIEFARISKDSDNEQVGAWLRSTVPELADIYVALQQSYIEELRTQLDATQAVNGAS